MEVAPLIIEGIKCVGVRQEVLVNIVVNPRAGKIAATLYRKIGVATQEHVVDCREVALSQCVYSSALPVSARADEIVVGGISNCGATWQYSCMANTAKPNRVDGACVGHQKNIVVNSDVLD